MEKLQHTVTLVEEDDFLLITDENLEACAEENHNSCFGKLFVDKEIHILNIRRCLRRAWKGNDFQVYKIDMGIYQFFFKKWEAMDFILSNGLWNVEDHLLLLTPWSESAMDGPLSFTTTDFWIQITGLPNDWYSTRIGKKLFSYTKDCSYVELRSHWELKTKFYCIRVSIQVEKPLWHFLCAGPSISDKYRGMFKYEKLHCLCFRCGCIGHFYCDCRNLSRTCFDLGLGCKLNQPPGHRSCGPWIERTTCRKRTKQPCSEYFSNKVRDLVVQMKVLSVFVRSSSFFSICHVSADFCGHAAGLCFTHLNPSMCGQSWSLLWPTFWLLPPSVDFCSKPSDNVVKHKGKVVASAACNVHVSHIY